MNITKDQIQKMLLVGMLGMGGLYYYAFEMMKPLASQRDKAQKEIASLEGKIKEAKSWVSRTGSIEAGDVNAVPARKIYEVMRNKIPNAQPIAWLPTRMSGFFVGQGIGKPVCRPLPDTAPEEFSGFKTSCWAIEIPGVPVAVLGEALANLENQEGLMQITSLQIDATPKEPESPHARILISTFVKSEK